MSDAKYVLVGGTGDSNSCWLIMLEAEQQPFVVEVSRQAAAEVLALHLNKDLGTLTLEDFNERALPLAQEFLSQVDGGMNIQAGAPIAIVGDKLANLEAFRSDVAGLEEGPTGDFLARLSVFKSL